MATENIQVLAKVLQDADTKVIDGWLSMLKRSGVLQNGRIREAELQTEAKSIYGMLVGALERGSTSVRDEAFSAVRDTLGDISRSRALQGFTPTDTSNFVFSLKEPIFDVLNQVLAGNPASIVECTWLASRVLDQLGLHTMEIFLASREDVIGRQTQEIAELSTPVVQLWEGILALPLIGTLDSARTGVVLENLLQAIVDEEAEIAIIDITGVPTVDTLVAQHLLKAIAAARLMGADCIISGIRPQIAQTMVHLGVELNVVSKATLADALALALKRTGRTVVQSKRVADKDGAR